ncbi:tetratricopeptide repeat protein [Vreelandella titanicae]|uniref:tetratricopeptide repeat protein n=1 Tax=Vreelandella titanicae TaxID=664683 RepID=UPI0039BEEA4D
MSLESIKQRIIKRLIDEIGALDATSLELMGHGLVELLENKRLVHHGINKDYKFAGYTVDSFSDDSMIIAQYSTEKGYFQNSGTAAAPVFAKIEKDINSAKAHHPPTEATKIYLMSTEEEQPSFRALFNRTASANDLDEALVVLDARELAKIIYDLSIERPNAATFFRQFLPEFDEALDHFEYFGRLPAQCANHQSNEAALKALREQFAGGQSVAVLHGLSGSGKTQVAIDFVHREAANYDNHVWLAGGDWHPDTPLSAVTRKRGGRPLNVVGNFNAVKTILVVDRIDHAIDPSVFAELQPGFDKGGVVIVTSQVAVPGARSHVPIPQVSREVALRILGEDPMDPTGASGNFVAACSFLPVILATARSVIESERVPRHEFYEEVLATPDVLSGDDGISILSRILGRLSEAPRKALQRIANTGLAMHDAEFIAHLVGHLPKQELQKLAVLSPAGAPGVLLVHEFVVRAARMHDGAEDLVLEVERYLGRLKGEMTPSALRQIHLSRKALQDEHARRGYREPDWLAYALLQLEDVKHDIFGAYAERPLVSNDSLAAVMSIIDAREQYAYSLPQGERSAYYTACVDEYHAALNDAEGRIQAEFLHHLGKAYRRCGEIDKALGTFQKLLEIEPDWHAALGQIVHLGTQYGASEAARQAGESALHQLLGQMIKSPTAVPLRVAMAVLSNLRSYPSVVAQLNSDELSVRSLSWIISQAALEGLDQFYDAFYAFTSKFGYEHPDVSFKLVSAAGEMFEVSPESIGKSHLLSVGETLANVSQNALRSGDEGLARRLSGLSLVYANALLAEGNPNGFTRRSIAKIFTVAGHPNRALEVINEVDNDKLDHWLLYRRAEAELALGMPEALSTATDAIAGAQADSRAARNLAAYFDMMSRCLSADGDTKAAVDHMRLALAHCSGGKFQRELKDRLASLEAEDWG